MLCWKWRLRWVHMKWLRHLYRIDVRKPTFWSVGFWGSLFNISIWKISKRKWLLLKIRLTYFFLKKLSQVHHTSWFTQKQTHYSNRANGSQVHGLPLRLYLILTYNSYKWGVAKFMVCLCDCIGTLFFNCDWLSDLFTPPTVSASNLLASLFSKSAKNRWVCL